VFQPGEVGTYIVLLLTKSSLHQNEIAIQFFFLKLFSSIAEELFKSKLCVGQADLKPSFS